MFLIAMTWLKYLNCFLSGLTSHFAPLTREEEQLDFNVPGEYLINANKVYNELRKIRTNKSPGPDMIPSNKILKVFAYELAPVNTDIYNSSIIQSVFPMNPTSFPGLSCEDEGRDEKALVWAGHVPTQKMAVFDSYSSRSGEIFFNEIYKSSKQINSQNAS
jgi:hypothetical protein